MLGYLFLDINKKPFLNNDDENKIKGDGINPEINFLEYDPFKTEANKFYSISLFDGEFYGEDHDLQKLVDNTHNFSYL